MQSLRQRILKNYSNLQIRALAADEKKHDELLKRQPQLEDL